MSTDAPEPPAEAADSDDALADEVASFLRTNFPQIAMHGGDAAVDGIDPESGEVWIRLSGACGGCGISPMTTQAIQRHLPMEVAGVTRVHVDTG
ncbi:NifU family protein [Halovivax sp.]|uniref:NifU family protein n=1 Tax=Halovivax sp. TaxID=1935978 RepID=UPI0025B91657|nr:NifU family protein [Halovivax sp.]